MMNNLFTELLQKVPQRIKNFNRLSMGIAVSIDEVLKQQNLTQKALAEKLEKKESEISKWLSGKHNFTIKSLANLEAALGVELITVNHLPVNQWPTATIHTDTKERNTSLPIINREHSFCYSDTKMIIFDDVPRKEFQLKEQPKYYPYAC